MADTDVAAVAADDDFDIADDLAAAFDAAEAADTPETPELPLETAEQAAERVRDEKGRFAAKPEEPEVKEPVKAVEKPAEPVKAETAAPVAPVEPVATDATLRPPPGWSPAAKVAFANLPPEVQQSVAKREQEVNQGFAKLAEYKPIEKFSEMAKQSGTTLDRALENYVGMENKLRQDFPGGIVELCQRQGIHPVALANHILARNGVAQTQDGQAGDTQAARQQAPSVDLTPIHNELNALKSYVQQQQTAGVQSEIERFASDPKHTFFDNVKADMGRLINAGYATDMADAYEKACWANPEIRPLLIKQQSTVSDVSAKANAATQARAAAKSITGSPIPNASARGPETSIEEEIRQLMDASV